MSVQLSAPLQVHKSVPSPPSSLLPVQYGAQFLRSSVYSNGEPAPLPALPPHSEVPMAPSCFLTRPHSHSFLPWPQALNTTVAGQLPQPQPSILPNSLPHCGSSV